MSRSHTDTWVIVKIRKQEFALPATCVRELVEMPDVTMLPESRPPVRGLINLRGQSLPLIDLRKLFGWRSVPEELAGFCELMRQREQDHRNWLTQLEQSIGEGTEFRLSTDPHACAFGKWYDAYRSESPWVMALLHKFERPHQRIHALASSCFRLIANGRTEEANQLVERTRNGELKTMVGLFQRLKELMRDAAKELAVVITGSEDPFAVAVDHAVAVENVPPDSIKDVPRTISLQGPIPARRVLQRVASLALILEPEMLRGRFAGKKLGTADAPSCNFPVSNLSPREIKRVSGLAMKLRSC